MSKNLKRTPYGAATKIRVREMREAGYSVVQITGATGVPGSTIARWAAEGGWRVSDLVEEPEFVDPISEPGGRLRDARLGGSPGSSPGSPGCAPPGRAVGSPTLPSEIGSSQATAQAQRHSGGSSRDPYGSHRTGSRLHARNEDHSGSPERAPCDASASREQTNTKPEQSRQERLEDALEKAAFAAEDAIMRGYFTAAGKAVQMADTLSKALERVRASAAEERPDGVFYTREQIDDARAELTRRVNRLAKHVRSRAAEEV